METILPTTSGQWNAATRRLNIPLGLLSSGHAFRSGSNFSEGDFLRLRITHKSMQPAQLFRDSLPKSSVTKITKVFNDSSDIQVLRELLPTFECIENWTNQDSRKAGQFTVALELLSLIATPVGNDDLEKQPDPDPVSSRIANSPRIRQPVVKYGQSDTGLTDRLSSLQFEPQTPSNKASVTADNWDTPIPFPSASTGPSFISPKDQDLQAAIDSWNREMFEVTGDEQTVNACLIAFIIPLASILGSRGRVRFDRKPFQVLKNNATDGRALYEAQVDGIIISPDGKDIDAFMEVKRELRARKKDVRMQEGAQMAAFVYSKGRTAKTKGNKRWMISMGGHQGYITLATYDKRYVDFLHDEPDKGNISFMVMQEYGPFDLRSCQARDDAGLEAFLKAIAVLMEL